MTQPQAAHGLLATPPALTSVLEPWIESLQRECGNILSALYLYGSALSPRFEVQQSDINLLLVVSALPFARLTALARVVRQRRSAVAIPRVVPLVLTAAQVRNSLDVFPAEFLDLQVRRALLAGTDVLGELVIARHNLRHQCEYELRAKLVGLRQAYLLGGGEADLAAQLLLSASGGLAAVLRQLLLLRNEAALDDPAPLVAAVSRLYGVNETALAAPFQARHTPRADPVGALTSYLEVLTTLIEAVDAEPES